MVYTSGGSKGCGTCRTRKVLVSAYKPRVGTMRVDIRLESAISIDQNASGASLLVVNAVGMTTLAISKFSLWRIHGGTSQTSRDRARKTRIEKRRISWQSPPRPHLEKWFAHLTAREPSEAPVHGPKRLNSSSAYFANYSCRGISNQRVLQNCKEVG